jgi:hypothetical protein
LLNDVYESLEAYAKAIRPCLTGTGSTPKDVFDTELLFLRRINRGRALPEPNEWVRRQLLLAKTVQGGAAPDGLKAKGSGFVAPVFILSGGTSPVSQPAVNGFRWCFLRSMDSVERRSRVGPLLAWPDWPGILPLLPRRPKSSAISPDICLTISPSTDVTPRTLLRMAQPLAPATRCNIGRTFCSQ